jgi:hypothetical protein
LIGQFYEQVIVPYAKDAASAVVANTERFVGTMVTNRAPVGPADSRARGAEPTAQAAAAEPGPAIAVRTEAVPKSETKPATPRLWLTSLWGGGELSKLDVGAFMERLGSSVEGKRIVEAAKNRAGEKGLELVEPVLKDIVQKYEAFGREATVYFAARARLVSVIVAMIVAFVMHVNAYELFATFLRDPAVRGRVIAQTDQVQKAHEATQVRIAELTKAVQAAAQVAADGKAQAEMVEKKINEALDKMRLTESQLRDLGVPVGWTTERWSRLKFERLRCEVQITKETRYLAPGNRCNETEHATMVLRFNPQSVTWAIVWLLVGGLLIGLGGPFWYDMVKNLTAIRSAARSATGATDTAPGGPTARAATQPAESVQPRTPVDIFRVAYNAQVAKPEHKLPPLQAGG